MVHVSQLKRHIPPQTPVSTDLSDVCTDPSAPVMPFLVLDRALHLVGAAAMPRLLVTWNTVSTLTSWEDEQDLRCRFPSAPAWGQAASQEERSVMTKKMLKRQRRPRERQERESSANGISVLG